MREDSTEIARFPVEILESGRRLVRLLTLTDEELKEFEQFLMRFPQKFTWEPQLEGYVSTD
jgi:hypothetical protein